MDFNKIKYVASTYPIIVREHIFLWHQPTMGPWEGLKGLMIKA